MATTRIFVIRHPKNVRGGPDRPTPLTTDGEQHSKRVADWVRDETHGRGKPAVFHSGYRRSEQLALDVGAACNSTPQLASWLYDAPGMDKLIQACMGEDTVVLCAHQEFLWKMLELADDAERFSRTFHYGTILEFEFDPEARTLTFVCQVEVPAGF